MKPGENRKGTDQFKIEIAMAQIATIFVLRLGNGEVSEILDGCTRFELTLDCKSLEYQFQLTECICFVVVKR